MNIFQRMKAFALTREGKLLFLLLLLGAAARIYGAWCFRHNLSMDAVIVALMAKHIAEGAFPPVFFYGQVAYGSLIAIISAFFMKVTSLSGFGANLGTAFVSFLHMPIVYLWARDIGGSRAGLAAAAFLVIGSLKYFGYGVTGLGGYASCLLFGSMTLWMSARIACETREKGLFPKQALFLLGIVAGLGWWSSQLMTAALLSSALLMVIVLGRQIFAWRILLGFAGFFIGSLPFWYFNFQNDWITFAFSEAFGRVPFFQGLRLFFVDRFLALVDLSGTHPLFFAAGVAAYLAAFTLGLIVMVRAIRRGDDRVWISLATVFLFIFISAIIYSTTSFAALGARRYLLPIYPCLAILLGSVVGHFSRRFPLSVLACLPLLVVVLPQIKAIPWAATYEQSQTRLQQRIETLGDYLASNRVDAVYAPVHQRSWTFALREKVIFSDLWDDFYLPNAQFVELSSNPGVFNDFGGARNFLNLSGAQAVETSVVGYTVHHDFVLPETHFSEISPNQWQSVHDSTGQDVTEILVQPSYPLSWYSDAQDNWLEITFHEPVTVSGLRLLANDMHLYPVFLQIEGHSPEEGKWIVLKEATGTSLYFWSGARPYPYGDGFRLDAAFAPMQVDKLRIMNKAEMDRRQRFRWSIQLLQIFGPGPELPPEKDFIPEVLDLLHERGVRYLYADRWVANTVHLATQGSIWTPLASDLFPESTHPLFDHAHAQSLLPPRNKDVMLFSNQTAVLTRQEDSPLLLRCLGHKRREMRQTDVGPWTLFDFPDGAFPSGKLTVADLRWTGFGCIPAQLRSGTRQIFPEEADHVSFFYRDNNWTTGNAVITGLNYRLTPEDRYLVLRLKGPHPHGHDAASLGIQILVNKTRLPLVHEQDLDFYFWLGGSIDTIREIRILSRTFVPKDLKINNDARTLGLSVDSISLTADLWNKPAAPVISAP